MFFQYRLGTGFNTILQNFLCLILRVQVHGITYNFCLGFPFFFVLVCCVLRVVQNFFSLVFFYFFDHMPARRARVTVLVPHCTFLRLLGQRSEKKLLNKRIESVYRICSTQIQLQARAFTAYILSRYSFYVD